jgi:hypothetical protein
MMPPPQQGAAKHNTLLTTIEGIEARMVIFEEQTAEFQSTTVTMQGSIGKLTTLILCDLLLQRNGHTYASTFVADVKSELQHDQEEFTALIKNYNLSRLNSSPTCSASILTSLPNRVGRPLPIIALPVFPIGVSEANVTKHWTSGGRTFDRPNIPVQPELIIEDLTDILEGSCHSGVSHTSSSVCKQETSRSSVTSIACCCKDKLDNAVNQKKIDEIDAILAGLSEQLKTVKDPEEFVEGTNLISNFWARCWTHSDAIKLRSPKGDDDEDDGSVLDAAFKKVPPEPDPPKNALTLQHGVYYSGRGLPVTPWSQSEAPKDGGNDGGGGDNGNDDDGDFLPFDEDVDDPDDFDTYPPPKGTRHPRQSQADTPFQDDRPCQPTAGDLSSENNRRKQMPSTSLYYTFDPLHIMVNKVKWLHGSIDGPYAGKHDSMAKYPIKLMDNTAGPFFFFYNSLCLFLNSNSFNQELLPALQHIAINLDLTRTPPDINMPPVGTNDGGEKKPMTDWDNAHSEFSITPSVPKLLQLSGKKREFSPEKTSFNRRQYT